MVNTAVNGQRLRLWGWTLLAAAALALLGPTPTRAIEGWDGLEPAFDRFVRLGRPICAREPAPRCVDFAWAFVDADGDQGLSVGELTWVRAALEEWAGRHQDQLAGPERSGIALGLWLIDSLGLERVHALYDADHDGLVSRAELLADVRLDQRPLGEQLLDPAAVDHQAIARRLGLPPALADQIRP